MKPKKVQKMKHLKYLRLLPMLAAALLLQTSCSSDDAQNPVTAPNGEDATPSATTIIHYRVTAGKAAESNTRATVNGSFEYVFESTDKLYIAATDIKGVLSLTSGEGTATATFEGDLEVDGELTSSTVLTATLVSADDEVHTVSGKAVTATNYSTASMCTSREEAIQKLSDFTGSSTYGAASFTLTQNTSFLEFTITMEDGTAADTDLDVSIKNDGSEIFSGSVTTTQPDEDVIAFFIAGVEGGTTLTNATVKLGTKRAISFATSKSVSANKFYTIARSQIIPVPEPVDLGLSVKWADMNVGAEEVTDYGLYFSWGGTTGHTGDDGYDFKWVNTPYYTGNGTTHSWSKYTAAPATLDSGDDAAAVVWGGSWRMPTNTEMQELLDGTDQEWVADYNSTGVAGRKFMKKSDHSVYIFLPAAGYRDGTSLSNAGSYGKYWSSTLDSGDVTRGRYLDFDSGIARMYYYLRRYDGFTVRAVQ